MSTVLHTLEATITQRKTAPKESSYTAALLHKGADHIAKKLVEEAVECAVASAKNDVANLTYEAADVLYHLLVLLGAHDISLDAVLMELGRREGMSGLEEKNARKE
jgi:phosphoribosyl-ATP pyrophosphohydrolase